MSEQSLHEAVLPSPPIEAGPRNKGDEPKGVSDPG